MNNNFDSIKKWLNSGKTGLDNRNPHLSKNIDDFFNYIFNNSSDGIGLIDLDFNIIGVNNIMSEWYAEKQPFLGKKCFNIYHNRTEPCDDCPSKVSMSTNRMQSSIVPYESNEQKWGEQVLSTFPVRNEQEQVVAIIEYIRDIHKETKGQEVMVNLRSMMDIQSQKIMEQELTLGILGRQLSNTFQNSTTSIHYQIQNQILPLVNSVLKLNQNKNLDKLLKLIVKMLENVDSKSLDSISMINENLTHRERQIAGYIQQGLSSKEISSLLFIAKKTVDFHRYNLRKKFNIENKTIDIKTFLDLKTET